MHSKLIVVSRKQPPIHTIFRTISICLSIYRSIFLSLSCLLALFISCFLSCFLSFFQLIYLSIYLSIHPSIYLSICLSIYLSSYLSIHLSTFLSICLSIYPSIYLSIRPSVVLFQPIYLSMFLPFRLSFFLDPSIHQKCPYCTHGWPSGHKNHGGHLAVRRHPPVQDEPPTKSTSNPSLNTSMPDLWCSSAMYCACTIYHSKISSQTQRHVFAPPLHFWSQPFPFLKYFF